MRKRFTRLSCLFSALLILFAVSACSKSPQQEPGGEPQDASIKHFPQDARMLEGALRDDPNNKNLLIQLGNLYYDWGQDEVNSKGESAEPADKWTKAVEYYKRSLDIDPANVNVRVDMANLMQFLGQVDPAIAEYRKALEQDPRHPQARINLILALGQLKQNYKAALKEYDELLKVSPDQKSNAALAQEVDKFRQAQKEAKK